MINTEINVNDLKQAIDDYTEIVSEGHRMHRKVRFLLDIRGLLIINKIAGDYVEFGVYRGEMMYAAAKILTNHVNKYIGLDSFTGLPTPEKDDEKLFVFESEGHMGSSKEVAAGMMSEFDSILIEGDFREQGVQKELKAATSKISVLTIDCNWPSSVKSAIDLSASLLQSGSIVYVDDYFVATRSPNFNVPFLAKAEQENNIKFIEFMTYPPCARAFVVEKTDQGETNE